MSVPYSWLQESSLPCCSRSLHHYSPTRLQPKSHWPLCAGPDHTITRRQEGEGSYTSGRWNPWASAHPSGVWASRAQAPLAAQPSHSCLPSCQRSFVNIDRGRHQILYREGWPQPDGIKRHRWEDLLTDAQMVVEELLSLTASFAMCPTLKQIKKRFFTRPQKQLSLSWWFISSSK